MRGILFETLDSCLSLSLFLSLPIVLSWGFSFSLCKGGQYGGGWWQGESFVAWEAKSLLETRNRIPFHLFTLFSLLLFLEKISHVPHPLSPQSINLEGITFLSYPNIQLGSTFFLRRILQAIHIHIQNFTNHPTHAKNQLPIILIYDCFLINFWLILKK